MGTSTNSTASIYQKSETARVLGKIGLPAPVRTLTQKKWDVIVVGGGHNGLACAAYLAGAGKKVLVLEARDRVGGACTLEETFPGIRMSPCAYLAGLLHPTIIRELKLKEHGYRWIPAAGGMFVPFDDGSSIQLHLDDSQCDAEVKRFSPHDFEGWTAFCDVKRRLRKALRPQTEQDLWLNPNPTREEIEDRIGKDDIARKVLFEWSMGEYVEHFFKDERLQIAYLGQGVIGTNASPYDPGTASINFHHSSGCMDDLAGTWGYVEGGMGMVSFLLCDIAKEKGVTIACGTPVSRIVPSEGVELSSGEKIFAPIVVSNADPRVTLRLLGENADSTWKKRIEEIPIKGCTVKANVLLKELPSFKARPGTFEPHHQGQINTPLAKTEWKKNHKIARQGELPERLWTELYFHTAYDPSVSRDGLHTMSVFAQYVPTEFKQGNWDSRRDEVRKLIINSLARYTTNIPDAILDMAVLGPPDIEEKVGLTGGHIFQGECLPEYMWDKRLKARTPMKGLYLCGAATHPGGSVIGVNGRNAAMEILKK